MLYSTCACTASDEGAPSPDPQPPIATAPDASAAPRKTVRIIASDRERPLQRVCRERERVDRGVRRGARVDGDATGVGLHTIRKSEGARKSAETAATSCPQRGSAFTVSIR